MNLSKQNEGLPFIKMMMLLSSLSPLFILLAARGMNGLIDDFYLWLGTSVLVVVPYLIVQLRIYLATKRDDTFILNTEKANDNKDYLFTYFFTILLPLFSISISTTRELSAIILALIFVLFILWNMNLHFVNIFFAVSGYRVFTIESENSAILITYRRRIPADLTQIKAHRLSNSVFIEQKNHNYAD